VESSWARLPEKDLSAQKVDVATPLTDDEMQDLHAAVEAIPDGERKAQAEKRLRLLFGTD
jgi:hypothetical protein